MANFNVGSDPKVVNTHLKSALKRGTESGVYKQLHGTGAAGSFRIGERKISETKPARACKLETFSFFQKVAVSLVL